MIAQALVPRIEQAHEAWERAGKVGTFRAHLNNVDPDALEGLDHFPSLMPALPAGVRKAINPPTRKVRRLSESTLVAYIPELTKIYAKRASDGDTFDAFIEQIRQQCRNEHDLLAYVTANR